MPNHPPPAGGARSWDRARGPPGPSLPSSRRQCSPLENHRIWHGGAEAGFLAFSHCGADEFAMVCCGLPVQPHVAALLCAGYEPSVQISITVGRLCHE